MATPPQVPHDAATSKAQAFHVQNKVAIVTGAGSGINLSFATLLLHRGCSVLIADLSLRPEAQALIARHASPAGGGTPRAVFVQTDVTQWPQLERMFAVAMREFGGVDIVCPGAGVYDPYWSNFWHPPVSSSSSSAPLKKSESTDAPTANRYASLDINLTHPIRTTQLALAAFLNPPPGREKPGPANPKRVVLVGSIAGQIANLNTPIYVAAKHGITGFIRSLAALEPALGIRVNGVAPGVIKTPLWTEHPEKMSFLDEAKDVWATPEEVAEAMVRCLDEDLGGGTILEVGAQQTRKVEALNDPGPSGRGHTVSKLTEGYREVFEWLGTEGWGVGGQ